MFFYLSKILGLFAVPTNALILLGGIGALLLWTRWRRAGRVLACIGLGLLAVLGGAPLPALMMQPLENRFPIFDVRADRQVDGVIVLGGVVGINRGQVAFNEGASRMIHAIDLARAYPRARIVFSGGDGSLIGRGAITEADAARQLFTAAGLDPARIVYEPKSRNTRENAAFTAQMLRTLKGERWLLVTSAFHMPRAIGCFRAVGLDLTAAPADFRTEGDGRDLRPARSYSDNLRLADIAAREMMGLVAYRLAGYTSSLFPAPSSAGNPMR